MATLCRQKPDMGWSIREERSFETNRPDLGMSYHNETTSLNSYFGSAQLIHGVMQPSLERNVANNPVISIYKCIKSPRHENFTIWEFYIKNVPFMALIPSSRVVQCRYSLSTYCIM